MMYRYVVSALVFCLLIAACGGTSAEVDPQTVILAPPFGGADVSLSKDPKALFPEEVGRVPSGTSCTLIEKLSLPGHGGEVLWFYQVSCDGMVGWIRDHYATFASGQTNP